MVKAMCRLIRIAFALAGLYWNNRRLGVLRFWAEFKSAEYGSDGSFGYPFSRRTCLTAFPSITTMGCLVSGFVKVFFFGCFAALSKGFLGVRGRRGFRAWSNHDSTDPAHEKTRFVRFGTYTEPNGLS